LEICLARSIDLKVTAVPQGKDRAISVMAAGGDPFKNQITDSVDVIGIRWNKLRKNSAKERKSDRQAAMATEEFLPRVANGRLQKASPFLILYTFGLIVVQVSKILQIPPE
jgi:DNA primase